MNLDKKTTVDLVLLGCPHLTIQEVGSIAELLKKRKLRKGKRLWLAMGDPVYNLAQTMGYSNVIEEAGGVFSNTCLATIPDSPLPKDVKVTMTNSFKAAHYIRSLQKDKVKVMIGDLTECLDAITEDIKEGV